MRCNPGRWAWGLIPIAMLSWIAVQGEHQRIEADLARRSQQALDKAGLNWAVAAFSGRDGQLVGRVSEEGQKSKALDIVAQVGGVGTVEGRIDEKGAFDNYVWSAALRDEEIKLFGAVPNEETRKAIYGVLTANLPKRKIDDRMKLAQGSAPRDSWLAGISFGIKQLVALKRGTVSLDGIRFSISGEALDTVSYKNVKSSLSASLPSGIKLAADQVTPPVISPYKWAAKHLGNQLLLVGYGPSDKQREDIFAFAKKSFPKSAIVDRMESGDGAPDGWFQAASVALEELSQLSEGAAELRDRRLELSGRAADETVAASVRSAFTARLPAKFDSDTDISFPKPEVLVSSPFATLVVAAADGGVDVTGAVPDDATRKALLDATVAKFPNRKVIDRLQIARGAPEGWQACALAAVAALSRLDNGRASLTDKRLEITGVSRDEQLAAMLPGDVKAATNKNCESTVRVSLDVPKEPQLMWRARNEGMGEVVLEGAVPDGVVRAQMFETISRQYPGVRLVDRLEIAGLASYKWGTVADTGLRQLARLRKGEVTLTGSSLHLRGQATDDGVASSIRDQLSRNLAKGFRATDAIEVRPDPIAAGDERKNLATTGTNAPATPMESATETARRTAEAQAEDLARRAEAGEIAKSSKVEAATCQRAMQLITGKGRIEFDFASATLKSGSLATLDRLVRIADACPQTHIEILGHTDSDGDADRNERLSLRRAEAVYDYLNRAGVDAGRLSAAGFGASRPLVANDGEANKAKNRRIEFLVKAN